MELFEDLEISVTDWWRERGWWERERKKKEKRRGRMIAGQDVKEGCDVPFAMDEEWCKV